MSQSLYTAMGGISAAQTQLNVISNNIANLNTTAFKSSSVNFSDVFSRTISSGSVSTQSTGGTNPIQVGVGVRVSAISKDFTSGSWVPTGKPTDLMIQGSGFFTVESSDGQKFYTRAGDFNFDENGYLVTSSGYKLMGTDNILSSNTSDSNVYVPRSIIATKTGNLNIASQALTNLNNCESITSGYFNMVVNNVDTLTLNLDTTAFPTVGSLTQSIQEQIDAKVVALQGIKNTATALTTAVNNIYNASTAVVTSANNLTAAVDIAHDAGAALTQDQIDDITDAADAAITAATNAFNAGVITAAQRDAITGPAGAATLANTLAGTLAPGVAMGDPNQTTFHSYATTISNNCLDETSAEGLITTAANAVDAAAIAARDAVPPIITPTECTNITSAANAARTTAGLLTTGTPMGADQRTSLLNNSANVSKLYDEYDGITVTCGPTTNGQILFNVDGTYADTLSFSNPNGLPATNFITATGMNNTVRVPADLANPGVYSSNVLDWTVSVSQVTSASLADSNPTCSISADGSIQATYSSGDTLSVQLDPLGTSYEFLYTTSDGIEISGNKCSVDTNVASEANFVIQMASITNTDGVLSVGSNLFKAGPNSGSILYSVGGKLGLGKIEAGGLEASNVDLSKEFSNMIVAQRAVQANSRVFTTTSNIMDTIVSMGR